MCTVPFENALNDVLSTSSAVVVVVRSVKFDLVT